MKQRRITSVKALLSLLISLVLLINGRAEASELLIDYGPSIRYSTGETEYVMDIYGIDPDLGVVRLKSQLEFPLDGPMIGWTVAVRFGNTRDGIAPEWFGSVGYWQNTEHPDEKMVDSDWSNLYTGTYSKFSHTESSAKMHNRLFTFEVGREMFARSIYGISLFVGLRYQEIEQDIIGVNGWQTFNGIDTAYIAEPDTLAIRYDVTYLTPHVGLGFGLNVGHRLLLNFNGSIAFVSASDEDDHVLRTKVSTADVSGLGGLGDLKATYKLFGGTTEPGLFLSLTGNFAYLHADGTQTQFWYGDADRTLDPETGQIEPIPAGTTIAGIPHDITTTQFHFGLDIGYSF